jgi:hypothetical protein
MLLISKIFRSIFGETESSQTQTEKTNEETSKLFAFSDELVNQAEIMKGIASIYGSMDKLGSDELSIRKIYLN